jgi:hypothetical protein
MAELLKLCVVCGSNKPVCEFSKKQRKRGRGTCEACIFGPTVISEETRAKLEAAKVPKVFFKLKYTSLHLITNLSALEHCIEICYRSMIIF